MTMNESDVTQAVRAALTDIVDDAPMAPEWTDVTSGIQTLTPTMVPSRRYRGPAAAFAAAASLMLFVLGGATLATLTIWGGVPEVVGESGTTIAVAPPVTIETGSASSTLGTPPVSTAPLSLPYDELIDGSAPGIFSSIALASNGSPVIAAFVSDVDLPAVWSGAEESTISVIRLIVCVDPQCAESPVVVDLADVEWHGGAPSLAVDPFDRPIVGYDSEDGLVIAFCDDPVCSSFETRQVDVDRSWGMGNVAFTPDGNPIYPLLVGLGSKPAPHRLDLVACLDRFCDELTSTPIAASGIALRPLVAADGSALLVYGTGEDGDSTQMVAWCADANCSDGPAITTIAEGIRFPSEAHIVGPRGTEIWFVADASSPPGDNLPSGTEVTYGKATCLNTACTEFELTYIGPSELGTPPLNGLPELAAPDGSFLALGQPASGGTSLTLMRFSETGGGTWSFTTLDTFEPAASGFEWGYGDLAIGKDGLPIVVYGDEIGLHLVRCPDLACKRPGNG